MSARFPHLRRRLAAEESLYRVLRDGSGVEPIIQDTIETGVLSPDDAALLGADVCARLVQTRLAVDAARSPFESTERLSGDRYKLVARLRRLADPVTPADPHLDARVGCGWASGGPRRGIGRGWTASPPAPPP